MALMTVNDEGAADFRSNNRWSANKKLDVVLRLLRGEKLEEVSREVGIEAHRLAAWRDEFLDAGKEGPEGQAGHHRGRPKTPRRRAEDRRADSGE
jgi:transposase-like protein